jgi:hypothetical protein
MPTSLGSRPPQATRRGSPRRTIGLPRRGGSAMQKLADHKQAEQTVWATGDYDAMIRQEGLYAVGARLVEAVAVRPGETVLDVACGTGNATIPAAQAGGQVTGLDLTPELLDVARRRARDAGVTVACRRAMRRSSPSTRAASTSSCRASGACSHHATRSSPTSSRVCSGPAAAWASSPGPRRARSATSSAPRRRTCHRPRRSSTRRSRGERRPTSASCSRAPT